MSQGHAFQAEGVSSGVGWSQGLDFADLEVSKGPFGGIPGAEAVSVVHGESGE